MVRQKVVLQFPHDLPPSGIPYITCDSVGALSHVIPSSPLDIQFSENFQWHITFYSYQAILVVHQLVTHQFQDKKTIIFSWSGVIPPQISESHYQVSMAQIPWNHMPGDREV